MAWKIYFVVFAVLVCGSFLGRIALRFKRPDVVKRFDIVYSLVSAISVLAVYGFVYNVRVANRALWIVVAVLLLAFWVLELFGPKTKQLVAKLGAVKGMSLFAVSSLVTLPGYVALVLYAFGAQPWAG